MIRMLRPLISGVHDHFFQECYYNSCGFNGDDPDVDVVAPSDFLNIPRGRIVTKNGMDIGCFVIDLDINRAAFIVKCYVHPRSCKLGLVSITRAAIYYLMTSNIFTNLVLYLYTTQPMIINVWREIIQDITVSRRDTLQYVGFAIINDKQRKEIIESIDNTQFDFEVQT